jgi:hypothetical protein
VTFSAAGPLRSSVTLAVMVLVRVPYWQFSASSPDWLVLTAPTVGAVVSARVEGEVRVDGEVLADGDGDVGVVAVGEADGDLLGVVPVAGVRVGLVVGVGVTEPSGVGEVDGVAEVAGGFSLAGPVTAGVAVAGLAWPPATAGDSAAA